MQGSLSDDASHLGHGKRTNCRQMPAPAERNEPSDGETLSVHRQQSSNSDTKPNGLSVHRQQSSNSDTKPNGWYNASKIPLYKSRIAMALANAAILIGFLVVGLCRWVNAIQRGCFFSWSNADHDRFVLTGDVCDLTLGAQVGLTVISYVVCQVAMIIAAIGAFPVHLNAVRACLGFSSAICLFSVCCGVTLSVLRFPLSWYAAPYYAASALFVLSAFANLVLLRTLRDSPPLP